MKMSKRALIALKGSIRKWEKIVAGKGVDEGAVNCPLCKIYNTELLSGLRCRSCPVSKSSGVCSCFETPYRAWDEHQVDVHGEMGAGTAQCDTCKALAQKELDFLKSLLPEGE